MTVTPTNQHSLQLHSQLIGQCDYHMFTIGKKKKQDPLKDRLHTVETLPLLHKVLSVGRQPHSTHPHILHTRYLTKLDISGQGRQGVGAQDGSSCLSNTVTHEVAILSISCHSKDVCLVRPQSTNGQFAVIANWNLHSDSEE